MKISNAISAGLVLVLLSPHLGAVPQSESERAEAFARARAEAVARAERAAAVAGAAAITDNWWDTPAGRRRYAQLRQEDFDKDLARFEELGVEPWPSTYDASSGRWIVADIEDRSKELEEATSGIIEFIEWQDSVEAGDNEALSQEEDVRVRLERIQQMAASVRPKITEVTSGTVLNVVMFIDVLQDLSDIRTLARSLRE